MSKIYSFLCSSLLVVSTLAIAEEAELLDAYLEDLPSSTSQSADSSKFVGQPVEIVIDENGKRHEVVQPQTAEYRRVETADGSELYEEVVIDQPAVVTNEAQISSEVAVENQLPRQTENGLEVIQLEPEESDFVVIEAPENQTVANSATAPSNTVSGHAFCQQNPYARECLLSKYLSLCKKDPQSTDCKSQLQKFDGFCETFPNAYKCKKAKIAVSCKQNPQTSECKSFTQRYCQKYPKAVFCNYN
ncbi:MAG: hypothetical protein AAF304_03950 [Pseudomonadota bacterium]